MHEQQGRLLGLHRVAGHSGLIIEIFHCRLGSQNVNMKIHIRSMLDIGPGTLYMVGKYSTTEPYSSQNSSWTTS